MAEPGDRISDDPESSQNKSWFSTWWEGQKEQAVSAVEELQDNPVAGPALEAVSVAGDAASVIFGSGKLGSNLSSGVRGMDVVARGGAWTEDKQKDYDEKIAEKSLLGSGTGVIASPVMAGLVIADKVWTYGIARPASTVALIDRKFRNQDMEWDTFKKAWNRSEKVSLGQAAIPDEVVSLISGIEEYDPWSDYDLSDLSSNPVFNLMSGSIDGTLNLIGPPVAKIGRLKVISKTTGGTTVKNSGDLAKLREDYNSHSRFKMQSGKAPVGLARDLREQDLIDSGSRTTYGEMVFDISEETRPEALRLNPIVANSHSLDKAAFADLLARTDDPNTVNNLILVSRGDKLAFKELEEAADPALWILGDMNSQIQANAIAGNRYAPTGAALAKVNQMFDNQLRKSENADYFEKVMKMFSDPSGKMLGSSEFMPSRRFTVEKIRKGARKGQYAFQYADYSDAPQWIKVVSESGLGKPVTSFMQWVGGRKPLGLVSRSGVRPNELAVEFESMMNSVPEFRGTRMVKVVDGNLDVVEMPASEWRKGMYAKIEAVTDDVELEAVWREMENETIEVMARGLDVSAEQVQQIVKAFQQSTDTIVENMTRNGGYIFDEFTGRELLDPVSLRQFMNSFTTVNMGEVRRAVQMSRGQFRKYGEQGADIGTTIFDLGMKIFRTDVLFRIGYTPKNAVWEPLQSSMLAHGIILAEEGISSTAGKFARNRKNQALHLAYRADVMNKVKQIFPGGSKTNKQLNKDMEVLLEERAKIQSAIDRATNGFAETTRDLTSPGLKQGQLEDIAGQLSRSARELEAVERVMDGITPQWRQVPDVINVKEVNRRTREYRAILGEDQSYADDLASDTNGVLQEQAVVLGSPRIQTDLEIENLRVELAHLKEERTFLAEERLNEIGVAESGAQGAGARPVRERIDPTVTHPNLPPSKNTGLIGVSFVERFLEDVKLTPDQRIEASDLGNAWKSAGSANKPLVVQWDNLTNRVYIDPAGDGVVELAAMKAAGFDSIPVTVVTKKIPEDKGIELPSGKWLTDNPGTGGSRRSAPKELHPDEIFPVQYGAIDNGRVVGTPTRPSKANDFDGDLARGRDYRATASQRQVENVEMALAEKERIAATQKLPDEFTADEIIPTLTSGNKAKISANNKTIERIKNSKDLDPEARKEIEAMVNRLEEMMEEIRQINLSPGLKPVSQILEEKTAMLEDIQKRIETLSPKIGERKKKIEEVSSKLSWEGSGDGYITIMVGGVKTRQAAAFNNEGYNMGAGYRAEASAARTSQTTWDPSAAISALDHHMTRTGQVKSLAPNEPGYWEELAYVIKAHFRGDRFIQKILEGDSDTDLMVWLNSREGRTYQKNMNKNYTLTNTNYVNNTNVISDFGNEAQTIIRLVKQYIPDENVRKRAAAGELGAGDLQAAMGGRDDLSRILSSELQANVGVMKNIGRMISKGTDRFWQGIATTPEDRLARWPFYAREFKIQLQRMVDVREVDGVAIPLDAVDPMRQAAHRMALDELEKTFYTIRRYNNAVYMARFLTGFPGAMFNSVYRYGRFAVKEPERLIQTGNIYGSALATFGVDEEGNEVKNISDAKYLVMPGTNSEGNPDGVRFPLYFMDSIAVGAPSLSYGAAIAVSTAYLANPATEEFMQELMGPELYELTFPYGVQANPLSNILSSYQKSALSAIRQFDDEAFLKASVNLHAHNMAEWEKNGSDMDSIPDYSQAKTDTRNYFILRLGVKFADSFSTEIPNVTKVPGQFMRDELRRTRERFPDTDEGREEAAVAFISKYGEWAEWYTKSVKKYRVYVPSTQDAYNRLWKEFPDLTEKLVKLDPDDPFMVSLFATGTDSGDFSQSVFNAFKTDPLPGDTKLISETMTPSVFDTRYKVEEGWDLKKKSKAILDAELVRLRTLRDAAETKPKEQEFYRSEILNVTTQYNDWLQKLEDSNEPFAASQTSFEVTKNANRAALYLDKILEHKPFMDTVKDDPTWIALNKFMKSRKNMQKAVEGIEDDKDGSKKDGLIIKYLTFVRDKYSSDVEFDAIWERYFVDEYTVDNAELETE